MTDTPARSARRDELLTRLARLEIEHEASTAPDALIAACRLARVGRTSVRTHETLCDEGGRVVAAADATLDLGRPLTGAERQAVAR